MKPSGDHGWFPPDTEERSPLKRAKSEPMQSENNRSPEKRQQRIEQIRRMIREQRYESEMKLEIAISRMLSDID